MVESVEESEYPESFHYRGGLEIHYHEAIERVMNWVRRSWLFVSIGMLELFYVGKEGMEGLLLLL